MRSRFDSRPLVLRRKYTAPMRQTMRLEWPAQLKHGMHLFFVICSAVVARNVANQEVLDAFGPQIMGKLYVSVALIAGATVAIAGWLARNHDTRAVARLVHLLAAVSMGLAFFAPQTPSGFAVAKYILMEVCFASMLLVFGMMLGASLGPREARKIAARIGAGGIVGGLSGNLLSVGALLFGSQLLYLIAAGFALLPIFWLPPTRGGLRHGRGTVARERSDVPALTRYGTWVGIATLLMVAATTLIDYVYRHGAEARYDADAMTAFFGFVGILGGCATVLFQLSLLDRMLQRLGLFGTATAMPGALIVCSAAFGLFPSLAALVVLKVVDSGSNMSLQQATGNLLLAPLSPRARAIWQGRIDGLAKRGSQLVTGAFLAAFPWAPVRVLPLALLVCAGWVVAIMITRGRYVRLLTEMLGVVPLDESKLEVYDGATLKLLESELSTSSSPARAAVILDLLEQADHLAPEHLLQKMIEADPDGPGALRVIEHLTSLGDIKSLIQFARSDHQEIAKASLMALADLDSRVAEHRSRQILMGSGYPEPLVAIAAGVLVHLDARALALCQKLAGSPEIATRLAAALALGRSNPGAPPAVGEILSTLANDAEPEVARTAIEALGSQPSAEACEVTLRALHRRELRGAAMRALAEMGRPVVGRIAEELKEQLLSTRVATTLTWVLGRIGSSAGAPALVAALDSPNVQIRLGAAVALSTMHRRRPEMSLPHQEIVDHYLPEIGYYTRMRDASGLPLPESPANTLLLRTVRQRGQASLEALFRMMSLLHPPDAMQGAFAAVSSRDPRKRQIALELLDNLLDPSTSNAIAEAVGGVRAKPRERPDRQELLISLARDPDRFLASLASAALFDSGLDSPEKRELAESTGEIMARTVVSQILELQSLNIFSHSSAEDLAEVASMVTARKVRSNTTLFHEGDPGDAMYLVRSGEVTLSHAGQIIDHVGPGEAFGIVAVLDQLPREMTATASIDGSLLVLRSDDLLQLLADRPLLMHSVFRGLTAALRGQLDRGALGKRGQDWSW